MRRSVRLASILVLLLQLGACNSTEVLTPPVDVGDGSQGASDMGQTSAAPLGAVATQGVQSAPLGQPGYQYHTTPQNTLEAQAAALSQGNNPTASAPLDGAGYDSDGTNQAFPQQPQPQATRQQTQPAQVAQQTQQAALAPAGASTARGTIRFLPIIGAPVQAVTPLSRQLGAEARAHGLTIKSANDPASEHILKGYFSAFADGSNVTIVYVWDILDASGGRLHRIQGQESLPSGAKDPWASVPASVMQQIATKSVAQYVAWKNAQTG
ncbi:hypothetical protein [Rhizobium sp. 18065]|uniref:hypothetical protein n=1 Tax=Rhizobium sp. 18065 TaxID=2681411 RepID=UPI0013574C0B|nr:hypothetical protein [Rhizobium sp. 18065]